MFTELYNRRSRTGQRMNKISSKNFVRPISSLLQRHSTNIPDEGIRVHYAGCHDFREADSQALAIIRNYRHIRFPRSTSHRPPSTIHLHRPPPPSTVYLHHPPSTAHHIPSSTVHLHHPSTNSTPTVHRPQLTVRCPQSASNIPQSTAHRQSPNVHVSVLTVHG